MFNACQKNELLDNEVSNNFVKEVNQLPVSVENNTLVFETEADLQECLDFLNDADEQMLNDFEQTLGFSSFRTTHPKLIGTSNNYEDELFLSLINPDGEIIIAKHLMKTDFNTEKTLVYPLDENYNKLKSANTLNFDWDDDIFEYLETGNLKRRQKYCTSNKEKYKEWKFNKGNETGFYVDMKAKVCFQRFTWYNSIIIKFKTEKGHGSNAPWIYAHYETLGYNFYQTKNSKTTFQRQNTTTFKGSNNVISHRPYQSTRRLKGYRVSVNFKFRDTENSGWMPLTDNKTLTIYCYH